MPEQRWAVIVNPAAGHGRAAALWPKIAARMASAGIKPSLFHTDASGSATQLCRQALRAGHDTIIVVGGDGTVNEVVNGFYEHGEPVSASARLGIVACGTGADMVRTMGMRPSEAAVSQLLEGDTVRLDVGLAGLRGWDGQEQTRYFLNFADVGMGGETVRRVDGTSKAMGGFLSFLWGAIATICTYRCKTAEVVVDGEAPVRERVGDVVVANGRYFGGGMHVAPSASLTDGLLDVFVLQEAPKFTLLCDLLPKVYLGKHVGHPKVWWRRAKRVIVRSAEEMLVDLDGELVGKADAEFHVLPQALPVIVPRGFR